MPVKNEVWIIDKNIRTLLNFCDVIIIADQKSSDGTRDILEKYYPKVSVIDNLDEGHSTRVRARLLETARQYDGENFIILPDADEIFTSNILNKDIFDKFISQKTGVVIQVPFYNLWRSTRKFRNDNSVWSTYTCKIGFKDDRSANYDSIINPNDHNSRVPNLTKSIFFHDIAMIHFQFVFFNRMLSKQCWYRMREVIETGLKSIRRINQYYVCTKDERNIRLSDTKTEWLDGWEKKGIDIHDLKEADIYWYDIECLGYFNKYGIKRFASLDIWDVDWEEKRKIAIEKGIKDIPNYPIRDPRNTEQRLYHFYLNWFYRVPFWRNPQEIFIIFRKSVINILRKLGLRRHYFMKFRI